MEPFEKAKRTDQREKTTGSVQTKGNAGGRHMPRGKTERNEACREKKRGPSNEKAKKQDIFSSTIKSNDGKKRRAAGNREAQKA